MQYDHLAPVVRRQLRRLPEPFAAYDGVVPLPPPEDPIDLSALAVQHEAAMRAIGRMNGLAGRLDNLFLTGRLLPRGEAISSSAIEGTNSTLDQLLLVEESNEGAGTSDTKQVRDYASVLSRFMDTARAQGPSIFTLDVVKQIHAEVMNGDKSYKDVPGELRRSVVWIGGAEIAHSSWNAPPPAHVEVCLGQNLRYMRNEGRQRTSQDFITRMAVAHAHFEAVHPFRDGNGRVGRILLPLMMAAEGHVPLFLAAHFDARKGGYYGALRKAQQRLDWAAMVAFVCEAIVGTAAHLDATLKALSSLRADWIARRRFRAGSTALRALDVIIAYPILTIGRLSTELSISYVQASVAIRQLQETGILRERTGFKRNRVFAASEVLAIVDRPYDDFALAPIAKTSSWRKQSTT